MRQTQNQSPTRILIFEEDPADIELCIHALMEELDCDITVAQSPEVYAKALSRHRPDVIISDSGVLGMDAREAFKMAKAKYPTVPFVICSAHKSPAKKSEALEMGADRFVSKDSRFSLLVQEIKLLYRL